MAAFSLKKKILFSPQKVKNLSAHLVLIIWDN